tara:strand:- start:625 stop:1596 length:972 start_codon:yes stop_codon:yes gene_type:complete
MKDYKLVTNYLKEEKLEKAPIRDGAGKGLAELGTVKKDIVVLSADTSDSTRASYFEEKFPERFVQVGVAEQNMIGVAAGLAYDGKVPYAVTYGAFLIGRPWEPIRTMVAYPGNHVVFIATHVGLATGPDGPTHQMTEDISLTACLPGFVVIAPADAAQAQKAVQASYGLKGPVYIRAVRDATPVFTTDKTPFEVGKAQVLRQGTDVTVAAHGYLVYTLLQLAEELKNKVSLEVINVHTIKPLDKQTLVASAKKTGRVFTVEDHSVIGGLGSSIAQLLSEHQPVPVKVHGVQDKFAESGSVPDLLKKYELDKAGVKKHLLNFLK